MNAVGDRDLSQSMYYLLFSNIHNSPWFSCDSTDMLYDVNANEHDSSLVPPRVCSSVNRTLGRAAI